MPRYDEDVDDQYDDDVDDDDDDDEPERSPREWAELRRAKKARKKAEEELAAFKRKDAFREAGINPNDPRMSYFVKGYDGDADPAKIKAAAVEAGFLQDANPDPDPAPLNTTDKIVAAGLGAGSATDATSEAALNQAFAEGGTEGMLRFLAEQGIPIAMSEQ